MTYKNIIFDLDGTLLNTLEDLGDAVNHALTRYGLPTHSYDAIRMMVGNGVRLLVERAVGDTASDVCFDDVFACFKSYYVEHCRDKTQIYDGLREVLVALRGRGCRMAIVSNKLQAGVTELQHAYFDGLIDVAIGERNPTFGDNETLRRKPAPDMLHAAMRQLGATVEDSVYVGDSDVDIETARRAGLPCISVLWGFRDEAFLRDHGAALLCATPAELLEIL